MPSRSRDRQLAKLAERRRADRVAAVRRRKTVIGTVLGLIVAIAVMITGVKFLAGTSAGSASPTPSATGSASVTSSPSPPADAGTQKGTVAVRPAPSVVACGATAPPLAGKRKPQFSGPPPMNIDTAKTYTATVKTSCGTIVIQLDAKNTPQTVNSFIFLAEHHFFDGQYFTRLDGSIAVVQGGDPTGTGTGGPGYSIPDELSGGETYGAGTLAMANTGAANSGGSQFFLITGPNGHGLDANPKYAVFGKVVQGLAVAQKIQALPIKDPKQGAAGNISAQAPKEAVYIDSVTITAK